MLCLVVFLLFLSFGSSWGVRKEELERGVSEFCICVLKYNNVLGLEFLLGGLLGLCCKFMCWRPDGGG
jgi:hypothetical protein